MFSINQRNIDPGLQPIEPVNSAAPVASQSIALLRGYISEAVIITKLDTYSPLSDPIIPTTVPYIGPKWEKVSFKHELYDLIGQYLDMILPFLSTTSIPINIHARKHIDTYFSYILSCIQGLIDNKEAHHKVSKMTLLELQSILTKSNQYNKKSIEAAKKAIKDILSP
jgi:hypothetical protein